MLKNQDAVPEPQISVSPASVSQARVTPDELTQALAAIEAREQAEASRLAGTIAIDQAVSDLHLDSTSDEIWAEVQDQRAKAAARQVGPPQMQAKPRLIAPLTKRFRGWPVLIAPAIALWVVFSAVISGNHHQALSTTTQPAISTAAPILRPLAVETEGRGVYADDTALVQLSEDKPLSQVIISGNPSGNRWKLFRYKGHVYLRGYVPSADTLQELQGKPLNIYNDDDSGELDGERTSNITLRVDGTPLQKSGGNSRYLGITVLNFQPDPQTTLTPGR